MRVNKKNSSHPYVSTIVFFFSILYMSQSLATITCNKFSVPVQTEILNLGGVTTIGPDAENGTVLFSMEYTASKFPVEYTCYSDSLSEETLITPIISAYTSTPKPLTTGSSGFYPGYVYDTGVPGVGVLFTLGTSSAPVLPGNTWYFHTSRLSRYSGYVTAFYLTKAQMKLIKTGPITPGIINGVNLPTLSVVASQSTPANAIFPYVMQYIKFSGQITVASKSCTTPDVTVNMGTHPIASSFSGIGSTTPWVDSSINLIDCPNFTGSIAGTFKGSTWTAGTGNKNSISVKLAPSTSIIDNSNGVFSLSNAGLPGVASGVGIQLAYGDSKSTSSLTMVNFLESKNIVLDSGDGTGIKIPFASRYIQTSSDITPGVANGLATFIITYK
ncbi:type 1 fimbrial protein [Klebsiella huaxiensis]|uniref:fimbrial protein n=1 Tax=Klebsiella huaxiensis TaxID=2153354 RepID=UPI002F32D4CE